MLPPAPGDGIFTGPAAVDDDPWMQPAPRPPMEHQTEARSHMIPSAANYEGGGIFASLTPGPSEGPPPKRPGEPEDQKERGLDFGPNMGVPMSPPMMPHPAIPHPAMGPMGPHHMPPPQFMPGQRMQGAPLGQTDQTGHGTLGLSLVAVALGGLAGGYYGGLYGALAGGLFGGAAVNGYRAFAEFKKGDVDADKEAAVSGTYAVGATIIGAVIWAKLVEPRTGFTLNASDGEEEDSDNDKASANADACNVRPVGP